MLFPGDVAHYSLRFCFLLCLTHYSLWFIFLFDLPKYFLLSTFLFGLPHFSLQSGFPFDLPKYSLLSNFLLELPNFSLCSSFLLDLPNYSLRSSVLLGLPHYSLWLSVLFNVPNHSLWSKFFMVHGLSVGTAKLTGDSLRGFLVLFRFSEISKWMWYELETMLSSSCVVFRFEFSLFIFSSSVAWWSKTLCTKQGVSWILFILGETDY